MSVWFKKINPLFCLQVCGMKEIILIGGYQPTDQLTRFISEVQQEYKILVR
jgi:hypothetical protein